MLLNESLSDIELGDVNNISDWIAQASQRYADQPAFTCLGKTLTYREVNDKATAFAAYLQQRTDLKPGDKIIIQLPSITQFPIAAYGASRAGLVIVNTNPLYTPREMFHQFNDSQAKAIVVLSDLLPLVAQVIPDTQINTVITTHAADLLAPQPQATDLLPTTTLLDAIAIGSELQLTPAASQLDDLAVLQYTGGTTGLSKGAMLSHRNVLTNSLQTRVRMNSVLAGEDETLVSPLPLYHIYAFNLTLLLYPSIGAHSILIPNPRDLESFIGAIKDYQFTSFSGLNTLFVGLCANPAFRELDFSKLHFTFSGGTALTHSAAENWKAITGCKICEGYGLSETAPVVTFNHPSETVLGSIGFALPATEVKILDAEGNEVADGESGELAARGPQVMQGYWRNEAATAEVMTADNFFKTGDIAVKMACGRYKIVDRKKDMIIVSGFNVYPNEIEDVLSGHSDILEAAVIGVPEETTGETVRAFIVTTPDGKGLTREAVIAHCKTQLTAYKVPKDVQFIDELPKSAVGKILRRELRVN